MVCKDRFIEGSADKLSYSEFAAAFFMLGGSLQDATNVCLKQLNDFQLAIALARVVEGDSGPVLRAILSKTVVPTAFQSGNRWLGSWAFWMLGRRDLSVRVLLVRRSFKQGNIRLHCFSDAVGAIRYLFAGYIHYRSHWRPALR